MVFFQIELANDKDPNDGECTQNSAAEDQSWQSVDHLPPSILMNKVAIGANLNQSKDSPADPHENAVEVDSAFNL